MIHTWTGVVAITAVCETCGWSAYTRNALGLAAQHARRLDHSVNVEQILSISYLNDADSSALEARKAAK